MIVETGGNVRTVSVSKTASYAIALFAWAETFILVGIQYNWALTKSYPISTENWWSGLAALTPFLVLLVVGLPASALRFRTTLVRLEPVLHLTASALLFVLVLLTATYDPFDMLVPFSWPFHIWAIAMTFVLLANMARQQRQRFELPSSGPAEPRWRMVVVSVLIGGIVLGTAVSLNSPAWYWAVSLVAHAIMAPYAARLPLTPVVSVPLRQRALRGACSLFETIALGLIVLVVSMRLAKAQLILGTLETKYIEMFQVYVSGWFLAGVVVAVLAKRLKIGWAAYAVAVACACLFVDISTTPMLPALLGYALAAMFLASGRLTTLGYAVSSLILTAVWILTVAAFAFSGMLSSDGMAKDMATTIMANDQNATLAAFAIAVVLALIVRFTAPGGAPGFVEAPRARRRAVMLAYAGVALLSVAPSLYVLAVHSAPPLRIKAAAQIPVKEPAGLCHAGYSKSDDEYALLEQLGASVLRIDFRWDGIQPNPDTWNYEDKDAYVAAAESHGKKVLAILDFDNNAVEQDPIGKERGVYIAPQDVPLFLEYVRRTVTRYKDRIYAWEIWNEPSLPRFWNGPSEEFSSLAKQVAETLHEIDPNLRVVGTPMHGPMGVWTPHLSEELYAAGAMTYVDYPNLHMYIANPRGYPNEFAKYLALKSKYDHPGPLWITELGDPDGGSYPWRQSPDDLAQHVIKSYVTATSYGVEQLIWFTYEDPTIESQREHRIDSEGFFGLIGPGRQWKPAAHAFSLFNTTCTNSMLSPGLVKRSGGLTARQVRTALYRRDNGDSTLILWYEPTLSGQESVRVALNFENIDGSPVEHDIGSAYTKEFLDSTLDVSERPTVITYHAADPDAPVHVMVKSAVTDTTLMVMLGIAVLASAAACVTTRRA
ncbi:MAG: hypothetical protein K1Y02_10185 [Candidatus Hydrogenedentes bacterium]|nr:hypothetical protein [Candidatus Hydrogenedentota bacterium]